MADEVEITSDAQGSPHKIALTGIGVAPAPVAELSPASLFFPDQLVNTKGSALTTTLTNTGSAALTISAIAIQPADFTESNDCPISPSKLAISSHCTITVNFDPGTRGSLSGSITITDNAADSPQSVPLSGKGVIAHVVQLSTNTLDFGSQLVGSNSSSQTVTLTNGGDQDLTISSIAATGDFSYTTTCAISPATISGGNNCPITVKFAATATGTRDSTLTITHNAAGSPSTITLKGKGADLTVAAASGGSTSATITAGATATYNLQISPTGYSGNASLACAFSGAQPRGTACTILPASVTLNGADPAPFTVSVSTTARSASSIVSPTPPTSQPFRYIFVAAFLLLLLICSTVTWRERNSCTLGTPVWHWAPLAAFLLVALLSTVSGCGSSPPPPTGTPAGNYNLTLTATASGVSKTSTLTLTVN